MNNPGANNVVIASNEAEAAAVAAVGEHHAQLAGALSLRSRHSSGRCRPEIRPPSTSDGGSSNGATAS